MWQVGDLPGLNDKINKQQVKKLVEVLKIFRMPFGYTHKKINKNENIIKFCNDNNMIINLSANNIFHSDYLFNLKIAPVCVVLPSYINKQMATPNGQKIIICPAVNNNITCFNCGGTKGPLCWRVDRNFIVGFPAHGIKIKKVTETVNKNNIEF